MAGHFHGGSRVMYHYECYDARGRSGEYYAGGGKHHQAMYSDGYYGGHGGWGGGTAAARRQQQQQHEYYRREEMSREHRRSDHIAMYNGGHRANMAAVCDGGYFCN